MLGDILPYPDMGGDKDKEQHEYGAVYELTLLRRLLGPSFYKVLGSVYLGLDMTAARCFRGKELDFYTYPSALVLHISEANELGSRGEL